MSMLTKDYLLKHLPPFLGIKTKLVDVQTLDDIIEGIKRNHNYNRDAYDKIYKFFYVKNDIVSTAKNIFDFINNHIVYEIESNKSQQLKTPTALLKKGFGDCKSFASFSCGVLDAIRRNENIDFDLYFRYAGYSNNKNLEHVYCVFNFNGVDYWLDNVLDYFDSREKQPTFIVDKKIKPMALYNISGIQQNKTPQMTILEICKMQQRLPKISGGLFGKKLYDEILSQLPNIDVCFLYLFIGGTLNYNQNFHPISLIDDFPIVTSKRNKAALCFWELHAQMDSVVSAEQLMTDINNSLTRTLKMSPKTFWGKWFNGGAFIGNVQPNAPTGGFDIFSTALSFVTGAGFLNLFSPELRFQPPLASFIPALSDWGNSGFPRDKSLVLTPTTSGGGVNPTGGGGGGDGPITSGGFGGVLPLVGLGVLAYVLIKK